MTRVLKQTCALTRITWLQRMIRIRLALRISDRITNDSCKVNPKLGSAATAASVVISHGFIVFHIISIGPQ
jgi:hypothetical protein